jgi:soluble lytic murein transglycosylase-like protein
MMRKTLLAAALALTLSAPGMARAQSGYEAAAYDACAQYGCDGAYLYGILLCESGGDPGAVGPHGELGVMQIDPRYWDAAYLDPVGQIYWSAQMIAAGYASLWACA